MNAIVDSMAAQLPHLMQPTVDDFKDIVDSDEWRERASEFTAGGLELDNTSNFSVDQVALLLGLWSESNGMGKLQVGVLSEGQGPFLLPVPGTGDAPTQLLWIHNDNAAHLLGIQNLTNHFSGLAVVGTDEENPFLISSSEESDEASDEECAAAEDIGSEVAGFKKDPNDDAARNSPVEQEIRDAEDLVIKIMKDETIIQHDGLAVLMMYMWTVFVSAHSSKKLAIFGWVFPKPSDLISNLLPLMTSLVWFAPGLLDLLISETAPTIEWLLQLPTFIPLDVFGDYIVVMQR